LKALLVGLPSGKSVAFDIGIVNEGIWVSRSPVRRCPGDKYVWMKGSSDKVHNDLEFRQASISAIVWRFPHRWQHEHRMFFRWYFMNFMAASHIPLECSPCGGMNFQSHPSLAKKFCTLAISGKD
jgi:hypothetical protein